MVSGVFDALHYVCLESLIGVGELFDALLVRFLYVRESLSVA
jgi:hypothetical protein